MPVRGSSFALPIHPLCNFWVQISLPVQAPGPGGRGGGAKGWQLARHAHQRLVRRPLKFDRFVNTSFFGEHVGPSDALFGHHGPESQEGAESAPRT